jgi:hypothetical protein
MWPYSAAWTQNYGRRAAIGVKPPFLVAQGDRSIGLRMYVEEKDPTVKLRSVACHELVHACSAGLKLPMWLNEGIAMVTTDRFLGHPTIRQDTLATVRNYTQKSKPPTYQKIPRLGTEAIVYHTLRGYWLVRYLEEKFPGFLKSIFSRHQNTNVVEREIMAKLEMTPTRFWKEIDDAIFGHFEGRGTGA